MYYCKDPINKTDIYVIYFFIFCLRFICCIILRLGYNKHVNDKGCDEEQASLPRLYNPPTNIPPIGKAAARRFFHIRTSRQPSAVISGQVCAYILPSPAAAHALYAAQTERKT